MMRQIALPLAALLALAGVFGLTLGVLSGPVSEGDIIARLAAEYVAQTGGALTDCYGLPSGVQGVWLMVICEAEGSEVWVRAVDGAGAPVEVARVLGEGAT